MKIRCSLSASICYKRSIVRIYLLEYSTVDCSSNTRPIVPRVLLLRSSPCQDYFVESTRGFKHFVAKVTIEDNLLYACTAQAKETDYPQVEQELKRVVGSFRVPAWDSTKQRWQRACLGLPCTSWRANVLVWVTEKDRFPYEGDNNDVNTDRRDAQHGTDSAESPMIAGVGHTSRWNRSISPPSSQQALW